MSVIENLFHANKSSETIEFICNDILELDSKIRSAVIINYKGKLLVENKRKGIVTMEQKEQDIFLMEIALCVRMRREHDKYLGPVNFTVSYESKVISITIPTNTEILCVFAEKEVDVLRIAFLILDLLETKYYQKE